MYAIRSYYGKRSMGILVIQDTGEPVTPAASVIRNFLRIADFLPMLYATGLVTMMCNREFKRLGDLASGTLVVYRQERPEREHPPTEQVEKPPVELTEEDHVITSYSIHYTKLYEPNPFRRVEAPHAGYHDLLRSAAAVMVGRWFIAP